MLAFRRKREFVLKADTNLKRQRCIAQRCMSDPVGSVQPKSSRKSNSPFQSSVPTSFDCLQMVFMPWHNRGIHSAHSGFVAMGYNAASAQCHPRSGLPWHSNETKWNKCNLLLCCKNGKETPSKQQSKLSIILCLSILLHCVNGFSLLCLLLIVGRHTWAFRKILQIGAGSFFPFRICVCIVSRLSLLV